MPKGQDPDAVPSSRRANGVTTEVAFIEAATRLFADKGYTDTSILDLAKELKLTTGSLYHYVDGKQDLLARVLELGMSGFLDRLRKITENPGSPRTKLALAVQNHIDFVLNNRDVVRIFYQYRRHLPEDRRGHYALILEEYEQQFDQLLQDAMDAGGLVREDPVLLRLYVLGMINSATEWFRPDGRLSVGDVRAHMSHLIMDRLLKA